MKRVPVIDRLGRPNYGWSHIKPMGKVYERRLMVSITEEDYQALRKRAGKRTLAEQVRTYIQWGLEADASST
jgi:hypothetical protein